MRCAMQPERVTFVMLLAASVMCGAISCGDKETTYKKPESFIVDPDTGEQVLEPADAEALEAKSAAATSRVLTVASRLAGLGGDENEAVESLDVTPTDASNSG